MGKGRLKSGLANLGLVVGSVLFAIALTEIGLRVAGLPASPKPTPQPQQDTAQASPPPQPEAQPEAQPQENPSAPPQQATEPQPQPQEIPPPEAKPVFHTLDPDVGWTLQAGVSGMFTDEGVAFVEVNSRGLRDREHAIPKPPNTYRIAILGDSFSEALQVNLDQTYWSEMVRQLQENCPNLKGRKIEIVNFGVTNYGTAQQLVVLRNRVWEYSPDMVLLAFYTGNDITDNSRALDPRNRPYFVLKNGELIADLSFRNPDKTLPPYGLTRVDSLPSWLVNHSRILQLVKNAEINARNRQLEETRTNVYNKLYLEPTDQVWQEAWQVTEKLLLTIQAEVNAKNAQFVVATLSNEVQVNPSKEFRQGFKGQNGIQGDLFYPDQRIKALGDRAGFPVFNLAPAMQKYAQTTGTCLHGFENALPCGGHWNAQGHQLAGELLAPQICSLLNN